MHHTAFQAYLASMDFQCLFKHDQENYSSAERGKGLKFSPQPCPYLTFQHSTTSPIPRVTRGVLSDDNVLQMLEKAVPASVYSALRIILTPPREVLRDDRGNIMISNLASPVPFSSEIFYQVVESQHFHKGFFQKQRVAEVSKLDLGNIKTFAIGNLSHRTHWFKLLISFRPETLTTTVLLHNLLKGELDIVQRRLDEDSLHSLSVHPLFIVVLIVELLYEEGLGKLSKFFSTTTRLQKQTGLNIDDRYHHFNEASIDLGAAAAKALGLEQELIAVEERMEFAIIMGAKIMLWFEELELYSVPVAHKDHFCTAGKILSQRMEYLLDGFKLQLVRLKRGQGHAQLNRLGLEGRITSLGNSLNYSISEQSRDIARESKRDSSAMKAVAVLTMFFLPGTFVAAFFAMPLFDWKAPTSSSIITSRFWIYWVITIPATFLVLAVWRTWYVFNEWRRATSTQAGFYSDFWRWLREGGEIKIENSDELRM